MTRPVLAACCALALSACASSFAPSPTPGAHRPPVSITHCDAHSAHAAVGEIATAAVVEQARRQVSAQTAHVVRPGQEVTMQYREGRLNMHLHPHEALISLACG